MPRRSRFGVAGGHRDVEELRVSADDLDLLVRGLHPGADGLQPVGGLGERLLVGLHLRRLRVPAERPGELAEALDALRKLDLRLADADGRRDLDDLLLELGGEVPETGDLRVVARDHEVGVERRELLEVDLAVTGAGDVGDLARVDAACLGVGRAVRALERAERADDVDAEVLQRTSGGHLGDNALRPLRCGDLLTAVVLEGPLTGSLLSGSVPATPGDQAEQQNRGDCPAHLSTS
ncbi:MAG TPA: hypothetical protein VM306_21555 [Lentzea sp.]|nr:hypothetical protein [Lentzea sp.]HUQ58244.1 hypothetical protein [Lentzea sp.]